MIVNGQFATTTSKSQSQWRRMRFVPIQCNCDYDIVVGNISYKHWIMVWPRLLGFAYIAWIISLHIRSMWETICDPTASLLGWLSLSDPFSQWPSILCIHRCCWFTFSEWPSILCIHRCHWFTFSEWPSILCIHRCCLWLKVTYFLYWQLPPVETNI